MNKLTPISHSDALHARSVIAALGRQQNIGVNYNNIMVSSSEPGIVDVYDKNISSVMRYATLYWPGGNPDHGRKVETIAQGALPPAEFATEAGKVRKILLGTSIGASALSRVPAYYRELWGEVDTYAPGVAAAAFKEECRRLQRPFAICTISEVTSDDSGQSIMHFWHPSLVHPASSLDVLKQAIT